MAAKEGREEKVKTIRILEIDKKIRSGTYPNATDLGKEFNISRATVMRDLDFLRDRYMAPIEYDFVKKGFYYTDPGFVIQDVLLSESEIFSIFAIEPLLAQYRNTPLEASIKSIFRKIVDFMPENKVSIDTNLLPDRISFISDPKPEINQKVFDTVFACMRGCITMQFLYKGRKDIESTSRYADPLHIVCKQGDWYMMAFCHNHKEIRMFSLARIQECSSTEMKFDPPKDFDPSKFIDPSFGIWSSEKKAMTFELLFKPELRNYVMERTFHPSETKKERKDGSVFVTFKTNQFTQVINWLLTFGTSVEVLNPPELIEKMRKDSQALWEMYKDK